MATPEEISRIFQQAGVSLTTGAQPGETASQRIMRITNEVNSGARTLASVQTSVSRLATTGIGPVPQQTVPFNPAATEPVFDARGAATIKSLLSSYGLGELVPQVDGWVRQGLSWAEIEVQLRDPSTAAGKVVDRLYPEIQLRTKAGKQPMSIQEIQGFRTDALKLMRAAGVPQGFYDTPSDMQKFIVGDVSLTELRDRINEFEQFGAQIAAGAGGELDLFQRHYGVQPTAIELAALVLDPDKALPGLKRQFGAVRLDVSAGRAGYGDLSGSEAERLADVGISQQQAVSGFGQLASSTQLFDALPGQGASEDTISRQDQLAAAFEGSSGAQQRIERQAAKRKAAFASGGSFSQDQSGFSGIGKAR